MVLRMWSSWIVTKVEVDKPDLTLIFDPAIRNRGVDGCQLNLSPSLCAGSDTSHINLYVRRATRGSTHRMKVIYMQITLTDEFRDSNAIQKVSTRHTEVNTFFVSI